MGVKSVSQFSQTLSLVGHPFQRIKRRLKASRHWNLHSPQVAHTTVMVFSVLKYFIRSLQKCYSYIHPHLFMLHVFATNSQNDQLLVLSWYSTAPLCKIVGSIAVFFAPLTFEVGVWDSRPYTELIFFSFIFFLSFFFFNHRGFGSSVSCC